MSFVTLCSSSAPVYPCTLWLQHTGSVLRYGTGTQIIVLSPHFMSCPLTYQYEAVLAATSGHCLIPCIRSIVSTGLSALALLAQDWSFGSSDSTVWKEFSSLFSPDHFLLVFLVEEIPIAGGGCFLLKFNTYGPFSISR